MLTTVVPILIPRDFTSITVTNNRSVVEKMDSTSIFDTSLPNNVQLESTSDWILATYHQSSDLD
jgi:hypothetical protein